VVNLEEYRTLFLVVTLVLTLVAAYPALAVVVPFTGGSEEFSEFWLLDPNHVAEDYPFNVSAGEMYSIFIGVGNHMGSSEYYKVYVKFCNGTQSLPDGNGGVPSSLSPLYEYRFFVGSDRVWESPLSFGFGDVVVEGDVLSVGEVVIDGVAFPVDVFAVWDSEKEGYFFQLFFELWHYDVSSRSLRFAGQFVGLWLNMTGF
jgi:uncharacterized membrane protein